jgi:enamine deaminase RidA (YjgF/YER057c/UK114 family)
MSPYTPPIRYLNPEARYADAAIHGGVVYLAGQVPTDTDQDIQGQTREVLANIDSLLAQAGSDKSRLLMVQIFLADIADIGGMNAVWDQWVVAGHAPPRATVQAALADRRWKIEVVVTAALITP